MMAEWWRSWHGAPTDPKWRLIAKRAKVPTSAVVAVGWALFDRASQADDRGCVAGLDVEVLADFLDLDPDDVTRIVEAMRSKSVLDGDRVAAWDRRQPKREDNSTNRVKAYRERKNPDRYDALHTVTRTDETHCNADETQLNAPVTQCNSRGEESREEESRDPPLTPPCFESGAMPFDPPDRSAEQDRFPEFWAAYPRKENRTKAEAEFVRATIDVDADAIIAGARRFAASEQAKRQETTFLPLPATWLRDKRWTDDYPEERGPQAAEDTRLASWGIGEAKSPTSHETPEDADPKPLPCDENPFADEEDDHAEPVGLGSRTRHRDAKAIPGTPDVSRVQPPAEGSASENSMPVGDDDLGWLGDPLPPLRALGRGKA